MSRHVIKNHKTDIEDQLLLFLDKSKIKLSLFQTIMGNFDLIKTMILRNNDIIDFDDITSKLMYVTTNIKKYDDLIISYRIEGKSIELFKIEKENLLDSQKELLNDLFELLKNHLLKAKEVIFYNTKDISITNNDIHVLISDKNIHSLEHPAVYSENYTLMHFYINGEKIEENEWKKHPLVRETRIKNILRKNNKF